MRKIFLLLLIVPGFAEAQRSLPVSELSVDGIYATKTGDSTLYCLLGGNACLLRVPHDLWTEDRVIDSWLAAHPKATATRISARAWALGRNRPTSLREYIWIEDGEESLNVTLVREGRYPAAFMRDMVEADCQHAEMEQDPALARFREQAERERAEMPEERRPHRLVSEADYAEKMRQVGHAESEAKYDKRGIWSDAGLKGRSAPQDAYLIREFEDHREWFVQIRSLIHEDQRLTGINRDPKSWATARSAGVPPKKIDEYLDLLVKLDANEELVSVFGLGEMCLIVADISYGQFDNGVIKGYVVSPSDPRPLVEDLNHWPAELEDVTTVYRRIADDWYLFEIHH